MSAAVEQFCPVVIGTHRHDAGDIPLVVIGNRLRYEACVIAALGFAPPFAAMVPDELLMLSFGCIARAYRSASCLSRTIRTLPSISLDIKRLAGA